MPDPDPGRLVELLYVSGCPNQEAFLPHVRGLLRAAGVNAAVQLVEITSDDDAQHRRFLGSPTLRVNGVDVDSSAAGRDTYGLQCRLYLSEGALRGAPPDRWILEALDISNPG